MAPYNSGWSLIRTSGSHADATKMVSTPLEMGVVKTSAIFQPIANEKNMISEVHCPPVLYPGFVKKR